MYKLTLLAARYYKLLNYFFYDRSTNFFLLKKQDFDLEDLTDAQREQLIQKLSGLSSRTMNMMSKLLEKNSGQELYLKVTTFALTNCSGLTNTPA
jgi:methionyl-tRNA synthetase